MPGGLSAPTTPSVHSGRTRGRVTAGHHSRPPLPEVVHRTLSARRMIRRTDRPVAAVVPPESWCGMGCHEEPRSPANRVAILTPGAAGKPRPRADQRMASSGSRRCAGTRLQRREHPPRVRRGRRARGSVQLALKAPLPFPPIESAGRVCCPTPSTEATAIVVTALSSRSRNVRLGTSNASAPARSVPFSR